MAAGLLLYADMRSMAEMPRAGEHHGDAVLVGGSVRDEEVIRAADEHGIAMVFTGTRHFRH